MTLMTVLLKTIRPFTIGSSVVLVLSQFFGRISKMTPVIINSSSCNPGEIIKVKIVSSNQNSLFGEHIIAKTKAA